MDKIEIPEADVAPLDAIATGLAGLRILFVNVFAITGPRGWTLVDAGLTGSANRIKNWAAKRFNGQPPCAVLLTHAHFDHVGALDALLDAWNVPVYAHPEEFPYLTGDRAYPPPDPSVGGGMMARMASMYPRGPINVSNRLTPLPADGRAPDLPGWKWVHTPGHTAGHVSFFREVDRALVVGDAFCTTKQESFFAVATQRPELHGPPAYFTTDWDAARASVAHLASLNPCIVAASHGQPMAGATVPRTLTALSAHFDQVARPDQGVYVNQPRRG